MNTISECSDIKMVDGHLIVPLVSLEKSVEPLANIIPSTDVHAKTAKKYCFEDTKYGLTHDESAALYFYAMENFSSHLNAAMLNENRLLIQPFLAYLRLFDEATKKLPSLKKVVWCLSSKDSSSSFEKGTIISRGWTITNCSTKEDVIQSFIKSSPNSTLLLIECLNGKDISDFTNNSTEHEIILLPNTQLQVINNSISLQSGLHIIHMREVDDDESLDTLKLMSMPTTSENKLPTLFSNVKRTDGCKYIGEVNAKGTPEGEGIQWWPGGTCHVGSFKAGVAHGYGVRFFPNGDEYKGDFVNGDKEGDGVFIWADGVRYEGEYRNDKRNGHGVYYCGNGEKYEGEFKDGKRHGFGTYTFANCQSHTGIWGNGNMVLRWI